MANSKEREIERAALRIWSPEDQDWIAPPPEQGGPELHNAATYSNWRCRCRECKSDNAVKQRILRFKQRSSSPSYEPVSEEPSAVASSDGGGHTAKV